MDFEIKNLSYSYNKKDFALENISFSVPSSSFTCIIGKTGSGKTTLAKLMCGLLKDKDCAINPKPQMGKVSFAFQFPESQLFETSVIKDTMFGPLNSGLCPEEAKQRSEEYLKAMGIDETLFEKDPFELSDGQKRRVALAGILAMENRILILDEPGVGIDPLSKKSILDKIKTITKEKGTTVFMITHNMDEVVRYADYVVELEDGKLKNFGSMKKVMSETSMLPDLTRICFSLGIKETVLTLEDAIRVLSKDNRL